jgi:hypothetical protein
MIVSTYFMSWIKYKTIVSCHKCGHWHNCFSFSNQPFLNTDFQFINSWHEEIWFIIKFYSRNNLKFNNKLIFFIYIYLYKNLEILSLRSKLLWKESRNKHKKWTKKIEILNFWTLCFLHFDVRLYNLMSKWKLH